VAEQSKSKSMSMSMIKTGAKLSNYWRYPEFVLDEWLIVANLRESFFDDQDGKGQDELSWLAAERHKAVVTAEAFRLGILGVNDQREHGDFRSNGSLYGVPKQSTTEFLPAVGLVHCEASQPGNGNGWVARQSLRELGRQFSQRNAGRGECVVPGNLACCCFDRNVARRRATANILGYLFVKIPVQGFDATKETRPIADGS
jgi:hypothetical protein